MFEEGKTYRTVISFLAIRHVNVNMRNPRLFPILNENSRCERYAPSLKADPKRISEVDNEIMWGSCNFDRRVFGFVDVPEEGRGEIRERDEIKGYRKRNEGREREGEKERRKEQ